MSEAEPAEAVLAEQRRQRGEEQFTRLLDDQLDAEEVAVVLEAAVLPPSQRRPLRQGGTLCAG